MKLSGKMISVLDKQDSVGGPGGYMFDSGCNLTGLRKVHIELGKYKGMRNPSVIIHGRYGSAIDRLGITFATVVKTLHDDLGFPPNSNDDASTLQKEMESSCFVKTNTKDKEEDDDESSTDVNDEPNREGKDVCNIISLDEPKEGHHQKEMKSSCSVESSCSVTINAKEEKDDDESWAEADVNDGSMDFFFNKD